jgi:hypothetical protein
MPATEEPETGGSRVHCDPLSGLGARLCPSSIAMSTPQAFPMASRYGFPIPPGSSRRPHGQRCALRPAQIRQVRAGVPGEGRKTPVPRVLLSATLAGPAPSGSTGTSRLCQGCSHPPRRHTDPAAPSYSDLLRQATGEGLSPPHGSQRLTAQRKIRTDHGEAAPDQSRRHPMPGGRGARMPVEQHDRRPSTSVAHENRRFAEVYTVFLEAFEHSYSVTQRRMG